MKPGSRPGHDAAPPAARYTTGSHPGHDAAPAAARYTTGRLRWVLLSLISAAFIINFLDRQVLSVLAPVLQRELNLSNTQYGVIVFSFLLGMGTFQIPAGMLMDRVGPRRGFTIIVALWSAASFLHCTARSAAQFSLLRFVLGGAECGNYSGGLKLISQIFSTRERALAGGIFNSCTFVGSVVAPIIVVWLTLRFSWPATFMVASSIGFIWLIPWLLVYPKRLDVALASSREGDGAAHVPLFSLLRYKQTWALVGYRALTGPLSHFYWFWLPAYLSSARDLSLAQIGMIGWLPYLFAGLGNVFGGVLSGQLLRRGFSLEFSRRTPVVVGTVFCTAANLTVFFAPDLTTTIILLCLAMFGANMLEPTFISLIGDYFPRQVVGRVAAITGVGDNIMSMLLMLATGVVLDRFSYLPVFTVAGIIPVAITLIVFTALRSIQRVELTGAAGVAVAGEHEELHQ